MEINALLASYSTTQSPGFTTKRVKYALNAFNRSLTKTSSTPLPKGPMEHARQAEALAREYEAAIQGAKLVGPDAVEEVVSTFTVKRDALTQEHTRKTIGRYYRMAPSKLYDFLTSTASYRDPHILGPNGVALPPEGAAAVFQDVFVAKCSARPADPSKVIVEPPVNWEEENPLSKALFNESVIPRREKSRLCYIDVLRARAEVVDLCLPHDIDTVRRDRISPAEVFEAIRMHPSTNCPDPSGISLAALQAVPFGALHQYLADWFSDCMRRGEVPNDWKLGLITPVFKGKDKPEGEAASYRPVSITSYISRTWERILVMRMEDRLARLHNSQFGFLRGRTSEQLLGHIRRTLRRTTGVRDKETNKYFVAAGVSFDCTDAFCKIGAATAAKAMRRIGVDESTIRVITSWLTDRMQAVSTCSKGCPSSGTDQQRRGKGNIPMQPPSVHVKSCMGRTRNGPQHAWKGANHCSTNSSITTRSAVVSSSVDTSAQALSSAVAWQVSHHSVNSCRTTSLAQTQSSRLDPPSMLEASCVKNVHTSLMASRPKT